MSGSKQHTDTSSLPAPVRISRKSLTGLLEISPDALVVVDRSGAIQMVNEQAEALFGYERSELPGQPLAVLLPANFRERHAVQVEHFFATPRTRPVGTGLQLTGRRKDGTEFPVDISLRPVQVGQMLYVVGGVRDLSERKHLEEVRHQLLQRELQAKEAEYEMAHLRSLFAQAPALIHILRGPEHVFEFFHPLGKELVGERDLTGMKVREALPEYEGQGYFELLDHIYQTGESYRDAEMSSLLRAADGTLIERFFSTIFQPWYEVDGRIAGILNFAVDVTEQVHSRRQLEVLTETLQQKQERLELAQEAGRIEIFEWNIQAHELAWVEDEDPLQGLLSGAYGEKLKGWMQIIYPDDLSGVLRALEQAIIDKSTFDTTFRIIRPDQAIHWMYVRARPFYNAKGKPQRILGVSMDVTRQKKAEERLKESEMRFRALADAMPQMVWTAGPDGVLDYCNQRWLEYTGMTEYNPAQGFRPVMHPDDLPGTFEKWQHALEIGHGFEVECRFKRGSDGSYRWHLARALPVRDSNGVIVKWYGTTTDIDDQKRIEEALRKSETCLREQTGELERTNSELRRHRDKLMQVNADLEKANRGRQFFSTMSHELRTPLASIIGFSELLLVDAEENHWTQQQKSNLERILKNGQHLLDLINDVLDLVKIEAGRMEVSFTQVDVKELITWVVEETHSLAVEKKLAVNEVIEGEITVIESNPVKLRQVMLNLVSNALRYTERGEVTISAVRVGEDYVALAVQDTGIGIPEDIQGRIFEAFYQVDGGYTRKSGGTGLGLAIVSQLTDLLGGKIELKSASGQGSTFTVTLPIKAIDRQFEQGVQRFYAGAGNSHTVLEDAAATPAPRPGGEDKPQVDAMPSKGAEEQRNLVLAVDDDPDVIALIRTSLQDTPYSVFGVQDPHKLIELVQEMHPSAITLDVLMPDRSGWQILRQLKSNPDTSSIPVIMLTVLSEPDTGYGLGADDYLIKPFQKEILLKTLQKLISSRGTSTRASKQDTMESNDTVQIR